jgi:hypothetical protein
MEHTFYYHKFNDDNFNYAIKIWNLSTQFYRNAFLVCLKYGSRGNLSRVSCRLSNGNSV